jgi:hypothetical protein
MSLVQRVACERFRVQRIIPFYCRTRNPKWNLALSLNRRLSMNTKDKDDYLERIRNLCADRHTSGDFVDEEAMEDKTARLRAARLARVMR